MSQSLAFTVPGAAVPQGSMRGFVVRTKTGKHRAVVTGDNARLRPWRALVTDAARQARQEDGTWDRRSDQAIEMVIACYFVRPASVSVRKRPHLTVRPDVDKIARGVLDALTGLLWNDDAQVVSLTITKAYAEPTKPACVDIRVAELSPVPSLPAVRDCRLLPLNKQEPPHV